MNIILSLIEKIDLINSYTMVGYNFMIKNHVCSKSKIPKLIKSSKRKTLDKNHKNEDVFRHEFSDALDLLSDKDVVDFASGLDGFNSLKVFEEGKRRPSLSLSSKDLKADIESHLKSKKKSGIFSKFRKNRKGKLTNINPVDGVEINENHLLGISGYANHKIIKEIRIIIRDKNDYEQTKDIQIITRKGCEMGLHVYSRAAKNFCKKFSTFLSKKYGNSSYTPVPAPAPPSDPTVY